MGLSTLPLRLEGQPVLSGGVPPASLGVRKLLSRGQGAAPIGGTIQKFSRSP